MEKKERELRRKQEREERELERAAQQKQALEVLRTCSDSLVLCRKCVHG